MPDTEMNYFAKFGLDASGLLGGLGQVAISFDAILMAAEVTFQGIEKGYEATLGATLDFADRMEKAAATLGGSTDEMQRLNAAAISVGENFGDTQQAVKMMTQHLDDTTEAGKKLISRLEAIGVQVKDSNGNMRSSTDIYMEANAALGKMPDTYSRNQLATDLYGRSWQNVSKQITDAKTAAEAFAGVDPVSQATMDKAEKLGDKLGVVANDFYMAGVEAGTKLLPALQGIELSLNEMPDTISTLDKLFGGLDTVITSVVFTLTEMVYALKMVAAGITDIGNHDLGMTATNKVKAENDAYIAKMKDIYNGTYVDPRDTSANKIDAAGLRNLNYNNNNTNSNLPQLGGGAKSSGDNPYLLLTQTELQRSLEVTSKQFVEMNDNLKAMEKAGDTTNDMYKVSVEKSKELSASLLLMNAAMAKANATALQAKADQMSAPTTYDSAGGKNTFVGNDAAGNPMYSANPWATNPLNGGSASYGGGSRPFVGVLPEGWTMEYGLPHYVDWPIGQWWSIPDFLYKDSPNAYNPLYLGMTEESKKAAGITGGQTDADMAAYTHGGLAATQNNTFVFNGVEGGEQAVNAALGKLAALLGAAP